MEIQAEDGWRLGIMGEGITIAIVDDGVDSQHPDISENFRLDASWNYNSGINSPDPTYRYGISGVLNNTLKTYIIVGLAWYCFSRYRSSKR